MYQIANDIINYLKFHHTNMFNVSLQCTHVKSGFMFLGEEIICNYGNRPKIRT